MKGTPNQRIGALEQATGSTSASFPAIPYAGGGHHDSTTGFHPVPEQADWIWALVQPAEASSGEQDGTARPHAWEQRIPQDDGSWVVPENALFGTTTSNPAYEENDASIANELIVKLYPAKSRFADAVQTQEWVFSASGGRGSSAGHPLGCSCCCCCVPCDGDVVVHMPQVVLHRCVDEPGFLIPAWDIILVNPQIVNEDCWYACEEASVPIFTSPGVPSGYTFEFDPELAEQEIVICCDPNEPRRCPVFKLGGVIISDGTGAPAGTYPICVGPIDMEVQGCSQKNPDDPYPPGGSTVAWDAFISADNLNTCDQGNWGCDCFMEFQDAITAECECEGLCPRTGLPDEFTVTVSSTYTPLDGITGTMQLYENWAATGLPAEYAPLITTACGSFWVAHGSLSTGCRWFVAWHCDLGAGLPQVSVIPPSAGNSSSPCFIEALAWFAIHQDFALPPAGPALLECSPLCVQWDWGGGAQVCFEGPGSSCPACPEVDPPIIIDPGGGGTEDLFLLPNLAFEDDAGETYADTEDVSVELLVTPEDDPQSRSYRYASGTSNTPTLYADDNNQRWLTSNGTSTLLTLSSPIVIDLTMGDMTIAAAMHRSAAGTTNLLLGESSGGDDSIVYISSGNNLVYRDDAATLSLGYTGSTGDILVVITVESGEVFIQASGMAKTSVGTGAGTITLDEIIGCTQGTYTSATNRLGPIVVNAGLYSAGDFTDFFEAGGWFDTYYGVSV